MDTNIFILGHGDLSVMQLNLLLQWVFISPLTLFTLANFRNRPGTDYGGPPLGWRQSYAWRLDVRWAPTGPTVRRHFRPHSKKRTWAVATLQKTWWTQNFGILLSPPSYPMTLGPSLKAASFVLIQRSQTQSKRSNLKRSKRDETRLSHLTMCRGWSE